MKASALMVAGLLMMAATSADAQVQRQEPIFEPGTGSLPDFQGKAYWVGCARCAAFFRYRGATNPESEAEASASAERRARAGVRTQAVSRAEAYVERERHWTDLGVGVMRDDRPGQTVEGVFEAQVRREVEALMAAPPMDEDAIHQFKMNCEWFNHEVMGWSIYRARQKVRGPNVPASRPLTLEGLAQIP